jgi:hypothetical protein
MSREKNFLMPLANSYFPGDGKKVVEVAIGGGRKNEIREEIKLIDGFPKNLVETTTNVVTFLEVALDRMITPYDGAAIYGLNLENERAISGLGDEIKTDSINNLVVITESRMIGRFNRGEKTLMIDYRSGQEGPEVVSFSGDGRNKLVAEEMITRVSEIDNSEAAVIRV